MSNRVQLLRTFNFHVSLWRTEMKTQRGDGLRRSLREPVDQGSGRLLTEGGFQECSGLEISMDTHELLPGGMNSFVMQQVGRAKYSQLVLKRGMFFTAENQPELSLWTWIQQVVEHQYPVPRCHGQIEVYGAQGPGSEEARTRWLFMHGLPVQLRGPTLNAQNGEIAIEELHIAHTGLFFLS